MASNPKKHKLSQDTVEEDDELAPSETTHLEGGAQKNSDGEVFFELSPRRRITIRKWRASTLVDIREYWGEKEDLKPGKKGISLSVEQWRQLIELVPEIDKIILGK